MDVTSVKIYTSSMKDGTLTDQYDAEKGCNPKAELPVEKNNFDLNSAIYDISFPTGCLVKSSLFLCICVIMVKVCLDIVVEIYMIKAARDPVLITIQQNPITLARA